MAGTITRSNHPKALWPGVNAQFGQTYNEFNEQFSQVFDVQTSRKHYEEDVEVGGFGLAPIKAEGAAIQYDSSSEGYTAKYVPKVYGTGFIVTEEAIDDNLYSEKAMAGAKALAFGMRQTKENVHANVFNRGFNPAFVGGDNVPLFSAAHPTQGGTPQSNILAVAADLSEASLEQMLIDIRKTRNTRGLKVSIQGEKLIVAPENLFNAERIIKTNLRVGTDLNDINAIKSRGMLPKGLMVWDYMTDPDAWFVKTNAPEGLKCFQRKKMVFKKDNDFDTGNAKAKATERYSVGWTDWRAAFGSPGA